MICFCFLCKKEFEKHESEGRVDATHGQWGICNECMENARAGAELRLKLAGGGGRRGGKEMSEQKPWPTKEGEIWMLSPEPGICRNPMFAGCMIVAKEPKAWGFMGYVQALGQDGKPGGQAWYRARWEEVAPTGGMAPWIQE